MDFENDITLPIMKGLIIIVCICSIFIVVIMCYKAIEILGLERLLLFFLLIIIVLAVAWFLGFVFEVSFLKMRNKND